MAGFLLYFPGPHRKDREALFRDTGAADLLDPDDATPYVVEEGVLVGPDGGRGTMYWWGHPEGTPREPHPITVDQGAQTWYAVKPRNGLAKGRYWIGWWNDRRP